MIPLILMSADKEQTEEYIKKLVQTHGILPYYLFRIEKIKNEITIDQIRSVSKQITVSMGTKQLFVVYDFDTASGEAQNAFLKTLEEKNEFNLFVLVVSNPETILPTIRSRSKVIRLDTQKERQADEEVQRFIENIPKSDGLAFLGDPLVCGVTREKVLELFEEFTFIFKKRLEKGSLPAAHIIKKLLSLKQLTQSNNLNPQLTLDNFLIFVKKELK